MEVPTPALQTVALISGAGNSLGSALSEALARRGVQLFLAEDATRRHDLQRTLAHARAAGATVVGCCSESDDSEPLELPLQVQRAAGRLDYFVDLCVPTFDWAHEQLVSYPGRLLRRALAVVELMLDAPGRGNAILHSCLPMMYTDSKLDDALPMLRGAIHGVNRTLSRRFGPRGLTSNCIETGLVEAPELKALAAERVLGARPPLGSWATPQDVANVITFMLLHKGYMTGQCLVMDGGMTSGTSGL